MNKHYEEILRSSRAPKIFDLDEDACREVYHNYPLVRELEGRTQDSDCIFKGVAQTLVELVVNFEQACGVVKLAVPSLQDLTMQSILDAIDDINVGGTKSYNELCLPNARGLHKGKWDTRFSLGGGIAHQAVCSHILAHDNSIGPSATSEGLKGLPATVWDRVPPPTANVVEKVQPEPQVPDQIEPSPPDVSASTLVSSVDFGKVMAWGTQINGDLSCTEEDGITTLAVTFDVTPSGETLSVHDVIARLQDLPVARLTDKLKMEGNTFTLTVQHDSQNP